MDMRWDISLKERRLFGRSVLSLAHEDPIAFLSVRYYGIAVGVTLALERVGGPLTTDRVPR